MKSKLLLFHFVHSSLVRAAYGGVWGQISFPSPDKLVGYGSNGTPPVDGWNFAQWWRGFTPTNTSTFALSSTFLYDPGMHGSAWCNYYDSTNMGAKKGFALILPANPEVNSQNHHLEGGHIHYARAESA